MEKEILKSALFGYSKISVCQYIATMNESFNAKLMAEADSFREERSTLQKKIAELEAELAACKQNACDVGAMLLEAGQYAEQIRAQANEEAAQILARANEEAAQLRAQAKEETDQFLAEMDEKGQAQTQKLALYTGAIAKLRKEVAILADRTDDALNEFAEQFLNLRQDFEDSDV